jgi:hypothetical protein
MLTNIMDCPRCSSKMQSVMEYFYFDQALYVRDIICTNCSSVVVEKFVNNEIYSSEWIDLNGKH